MKKIIMIVILCLMMLGCGIKPYYDTIEFDILIYHNNRLYDVEDKIYAEIERHQESGYLLYKINVKRVGMNENIDEYNYILINTNQYYRSK